MMLHAEHLHRGEVLHKLDVLNELVVCRGASVRPVPRSDRPPASRSATDELTAMLNPKHTFGNFVVGPSNRVAHAASITSAQSWWVAL